MAAVFAVPEFTQGVFAHHPDPYAVLGVPLSASEEQINRGFRQVAMSLRSGFVGNSEEAEQARILFAKVVTPARSLLIRAVDKAEHDAALRLKIGRVLEGRGVEGLMPNTVEALWLCQAQEVEAEYIRLVSRLAQDLYQSPDQLVDQVHQISQLNLAYLLIQQGGRPERPIRTPAPNRSRPLSSSSTPAGAAPASAPDDLEAPTDPTPRSPLDSQGTRPVDRHRQAQQLYHKAQEWITRHHFRKAIQVLGQAIVQDPRTALYYLERARLYRRLNDLNLARADYDHVIQLEPNHGEALQGLRDILSGHISKPLERSARPQPQPDPPDPNRQEAQQLHQEAIALLKEKKYRPAIRVLTLALTKDPANITLLLERARALRWINELEMARADYDQVVQQDPHHVEALQGLRDILLQSLRAAQAESVELDRLKQQRQEEARVRHQQALRMIDRGQFREAIQYLTYAIDRDPDTLDYYLERARIQRQLNNKGMAYADYKRVIQIDPNHAEAQQGLAETKPPTPPPQKSPSAEREPKSQLERILFSDISHLLPRKKDPKEPKTLPGSQPGPSAPPTEPPQDLGR